MQLSILLLAFDCASVAVTTTALRIAGSTAVPAAIPDLATFKQSSGSCYVSDDGAFTAEDEIRQVNGRGTVRIKNLFGKDYGKVIRSCGNCSGNGEARNVVIENSVAVDSDVLCGVNRNYGDTCQISKTCQDGCNRNEGNSSGKEPKKIGSGPDGTCCTVSGASKNC